MLDFLITLVTCSAAVSAAALLYIAALPALAKRCSAKGRYYAWLIIVTALLVPFRPEAGKAVITITVPEELPQVARVFSEAPPPIQTAAYIVSSPPRITKPALSWEQAAMFLWLSGVLGMLAFRAVQHMRFVKRVKRWSRVIDDPQPREMLRVLSQHMGIKRGVGVMQCPCIPAPMIIGVFRHVLLLPDTGYSDEDLVFILTHELIHVKRMDLWYKLLVLAAQAVHWFNPVVYLVSKEIAALCELSCDEAVTRGCDKGERQRYCEAIIGAISSNCKARTAISTNFNGGKKGMKKRLFSIMDLSKKRYGAALICGVLVMTITAGFVLTTDTGANEQPEAIAPKFSSQEELEGYQNRFERYKDFGLVYDKDNDMLYYKGKLVRYFEDFYPVGDFAYAGIDYSNDDGRVTVRAIRDYREVVYNPDGSYDPAGKLIGVEPYVRVESDSLDWRQIDRFAAGSSVLSETGGVETQGKTIEEIFADLGEFGITYRDESLAGGLGNVYYNGELVGRFIDIRPDGGVFTMTSSDYGQVDIRTVYDRTAQIVGVWPHITSDRKFFSADGRPVIFAVDEIKPGETYHIGGMLLDEGERFTFDLMTEDSGSLQVFADTAYNSEDPSPRFFVTQRTVSEGGLAISEGFTADARRQYFFYIVNKCDQPITNITGVISK